MTWPLYAKGGAENGQVAEGLQEFSHGATVSEPSISPTNPLLLFWENSGLQPNNIILNASSTLTSHHAVALVVLVSALSSPMAPSRHFPT